MKPIIFFFIVLLLSIYKGYSQVDSETLRIIKCQEQLETEKSIYNLKEIKTYYPNGKVKHHGLYARFADDSVERYFPIGVLIDYHENGNLKSISHISKISDQGMDTIVWFDKKGQIEYMQIIINNPKQIKYIDTSSTVLTSISLQKNYVLDEKCCYIQKEESFIDSLPIFHQFPENIIQLYYQDGIKRQMGRYKMNTDIKDYIPYGNIIYFDKNGKQEKIISLQRPREKNHVQAIVKIKMSELDVRWDELVYNGSNSPLISRYVNDYIEEFRKLPLKFLYNKFLFYGTYQIKEDTVDCFIFEFYNPNTDLRNASESQFVITKSGYWNEYLFLITFKNGQFKTFTAKEVDAYSDYNRSFVSASIESDYFFIEKLGEKENITLYRRGKIITDQNFYFLITDNKEKKVIVIAPNSLNNHLDKEISYLNISGRGQYKVLVLKWENEIRAYLSSLPNIDEDLKQQIHKGSFPPSHIDVVFQKYMDK